MAADRTALRAVALALGNAVVFLLVTALCTQVHRIRVHSPWQDDPYNTMLSIALLLVPALTVVIALRLLAWRRPGGPDRTGQLLRAAAILDGIVALTLAVEWTSVLAGARRTEWTRVTAGLLLATAALSLTTVAVGATLVRRGAVRRVPGGWQGDWLPDVAAVLALVPGLRWVATDDVVARVRRHALVVFVAVSLVGAVLVAGALAVGESWTDPVLIGWAVAVVATSNLACCLLTNAALGVVVRAGRTGTRRVVENAVVVGCVAVQPAVAWHDPLWRLLGGGELRSPGELAGLTFGIGLVATLLTLAITAHRRYA